MTPKTCFHVKVLEMTVYSVDQITANAMNVLFVSKTHFCKNKMFEAKRNSFYVEELPSSAIQNEKLGHIRV